MHDIRSRRQRGMLIQPSNPDDGVPAGGGRFGAGDAMLDPQALERLRDLDPDGRLGVVTRVLTAYRGSLARQVDEIAAAQAGGDGRSLLRVVHTLKSSSAAVGASRLSVRCAELEEACRGVSGPWPGPAVEALIHEGRAVLAAVEAMLSR